MNVYAQDILEDYHFACIDDYGTPVYVNKTNSQELVWLTEVVFSKRPPTQKEIQEKEDEKISQRIKSDFERNCNTCIFLERVPHKKSPKEARGGKIDVALYGKCKSIPRPSSWSTYEAKQFRVGEVVRFYPIDAMFMDCYVSRFK